MAFVLAGLTLSTCVLAFAPAGDNMILYRKAKQAASAARVRIPAAELEELLSDFAGPDPTAARVAVRRFAELGASNIVAVALEYRASSVQIEAAKHLKGTKDREVVSSAVRALEVANNDLLMGGLEVKLANNELKSLLIEVICDATGLDRRDVSVDDPESIEKFIDTVRQSLALDK